MKPKVFESLTIRIVPVKKITSMGLFNLFKLCDYAIHSNKLKQS